MNRLVKLVVDDMLGREVAVLVNVKKAPGSYEAKFDAAGLASGIYFYRLTEGDFVGTRKLLPWRKLRTHSILGHLLLIA